MTVSQRTVCRQYMVKVAGFIAVVLSIAMIEQISHLEGSSVFEIILLDFLAGLTVWFLFGLLFYVPKHNQLHLTDRALIFRVGILFFIARWESVRFVELFRGSVKVRKRRGRLHIPLEFFEDRDEAIRFCQLVREKAKLKPFDDPR